MYVVHVYGGKGAKGCEGSLKIFFFFISIFLADKFERKLMVFS